MEPARMKRVSKVNIEYTVRREITLEEGALEALASDYVIRQLGLTPSDIVLERYPDHVVMRVYVDADVVDLTPELQVATAPIRRKRRAAK